VRRCPHCHTITMFYSNQGKLDLGLLPDIPNNDFEIIS
jgi:hypothetical protein